MKYALGNGINKVEFVALWVLLTCAAEKEVRRVQVLGDSKLVIDWVNRKIAVENLRLNHLLEAIRTEIDAFEWISFIHIYQRAEIPCRRSLKADHFYVQGYLCVNGILRRKPPERFGGPLY